MYSIALCMQQNDLSYSVLRGILNDESKNMYWKQIVREIVDYKKDERVKWMLKNVLKSVWADSLTKVYAENGLKRLEKEKKLNYVAPSSHKKAIVLVESLNCSELENFLSELCRKRNYGEVYRYAIYGIKKFHQTKTLLYYKGVSAYRIGEIDIGIETLILLIEKFPNYPVDKNLEDILLKDALKRPKCKDKERIIRGYFHK